MIAASPTGTDFLMLAVIFVLLLVLVVLAVAEMGLSKMTKPKAAALADEGRRGSGAIQRLVDEPECRPPSPVSSPAACSARGVSRWV
jgi:hypothetical protein